MFDCILDFVVSIYTVTLCRLHRIFCGLETYKEDPDYSLHREGTERLPCVFPRLFIKRGIHIVDVLFSKLILGKPQSFAEALEVYDFSCT